MSLADRHRQDLCATAAQLDPDAATVCPPWTVRDLLAHLIVRDTRPDALPGTVIPALSGHTDRLIEQVARTDITDLIERVRSGPPVWSPMHLTAVDDRVNLVELVVHHEDLRRAQPSWEPTPLDAATSRKLWAQACLAARWVHRQAPAGVVFVAPGFGRKAVHRPPDGAGTVVVEGPPVELLLHTMGRARVAQVQVSGEESDIAAFAGSVG